MTTPGGTGLAGEVGVIDCPICIGQLDWEQAPLLTLDADGTETPLDLRTVRGDANRQRLLMHAYRRCPGNDAQPSHLLPERFPGLGTRPVTIGLVGASGTGKTHLLAAMVSRLHDAALMARMGLTVQALDLRMHAAYLDGHVSRFIDRREQLPATRIDAPVEFAVGLVVEEPGTGRSHTVVIFDMSGERLQRSDRDLAFVNQLSGLLCVVDPTAVRDLTGPGLGGDGGDRAFDATMDRLRQARCRPGAPYVPIPAVTVVTKADLLTRRGYAEINRWLPYGLHEDLDLGTVEEESRAVYAFLASRNGRRWLGPTHECWDSTLHLASATGTSAVVAEEGPRAVGRFPKDSFRQRRVLRPLLTLFALTGVLDMATARNLGRPEAAR
ncbi:hypothetical protein ACFRAR_08135 [Kitasatospora sp. NPDC056651]|uniref:hypothetical protein n=1 Tax=Kitasatospora sp. NPDC056651 TaxID=3345892 RepID=UPI0036C2F89E